MDVRRFNRWFQSNFAYIMRFPYQPFSLPLYSAFKKDKQYRKDKNEKRVVSLRRNTLVSLNQERVVTLNRNQVVSLSETSSYQDEHAVMQLKQRELTQKIARLEERLIAEELPSDLYYKYAAKYNEEKEAIEEQLSKAAGQVSNVDLAIDFAVNLPKKWLSASYHIKQRLQNLLFPEGIYYNRENDQSRTTRINSVFLYLAYLKQVMLKQERGIPALQLNYASLSRSVAGAGLEPTTFGL